MQSPSSAVRLDRAALADLGVAVPGYDRDTLRPSIVHLGVGGFHRAHLATYVHELCATGNTDWAIVGAGVLETDRTMAEVLESQDGLYTLIVRGPSGTDIEVIGSIIDFHWAWDDAEPLINQIADPVTQLVSLTITEGGYPIDDVSGAYLPESELAGPKSVFGILAAGLERRRAAGGLPLTVVSCDNILSNGAVTEAATLGEAARLDPDLADWISRTIAFPNSMVDRITPATSDADREWLADEAGLLDRWPVVTEPFRQWVLEDRFAGERPPLEQLDIILTADVEPYEHLKLRLLNAGHSCLAYLAALEGFETVDQAMAAPHIRAFLESFLLVEARPVLPDVAGIDVDSYIASLLERFANPAIGDQISRLCLDGSAKFPKFLLPTVRAQLAENGPIDRSALALAGWCEYLAASNRPETNIEASADPLLDDAIEHANASIDDPAAFLQFAEVFGEDLSDDAAFAAAFESALGDLRTIGVRPAVERLLSDG